MCRVIRDRQPHSVLATERREVRQRAESSPRLRIRWPRCGSEPLQQGDRSAGVRVEKAVQVQNIEPPPRQLRHVPSPEGEVIQDGRQLAPGPQRQRRTIRPYRQVRLRRRRPQCLPQRAIFCLLDLLSYFQQPVHGADRVTPDDAHAGAAAPDRECLRPEGSPERQRDRHSAPAARWPMPCLGQHPSQVCRPELHRRRRGAREREAVRLRPNRGREERDTEDMEYRE